MISLITRLGAENLSTFQELKMCIGGQTNRNFEWIILARPSVHEYVESDEFNMRLKTFGIHKKTRIIKCTSNNRSSILNVGIKKSSGTYFVVVDDDDLITTNFVDVFYSAMKQSKTKNLLRAQVVKQVYQEFPKLSNHEVPMSRFEYIWPSSFNLIQHFYSNQTPNLSIAFPRKEMVKSKITFDENLRVVEDWDYLCKAAIRYQVTDIPHFVGVYRQRSKGKTRSSTLHSQKEWSAAESIVRDRLWHASVTMNVGEILYLDRHKFIKVNKDRDQISRLARRFVGIFGSEYSGYTTIRQIYRRLDRYWRALK